MENQLLKSQAEKRRINDTYFALNGSKVFINRNTRINCDDVVAKKILCGLMGNEENAGVSEISVRPFDEKVIGMINHEFGQVYENKEDEYALVIDSNKISIYANSDRAVRYAACAVSAHYYNGMKCGILYNVPICPFRSVKVYLPSERNISFFKEFVDMCMFYGYNTLVIEISGAMEYKRHPEVNEGWVEYCDLFRDDPMKTTDVYNLLNWRKNSLNVENGEGYYISQAQTRELAEYCAERGIEIIPEVPSLSHCDYLMTRNHELAEHPDDPLPSMYCPSNPAVYDLLFDIFDEVIEVFHPKTIHIGHDEWFYYDGCEKCRGKEPAKIYADDITKIHDYLALKGVGTMMWGDELLNAVDDFTGKFEGGNLQIVRHVPNGKYVDIRGKKYPLSDQYWSWEADLAGVADEGLVFTMPPVHEAINLIPKDIKVMNWYFSIFREGDKVFKEHGLWHVAGNMIPRGNQRWMSRIAEGNGLYGASLSHWTILDRKHVQRRSTCFNMAYLSMMMWNRDFNEYARTKNTEKVATEIYWYNNRNNLKQNYIEIVHTTNIDREHVNFTDGWHVDLDKDRIGYYNVYYEDGSIEKVDVCWGHNIGNISAEWDKLETPLGVMGDTETTYSCDFVRCGKETYYKTLISVKKKVRYIQPDFFEEYKNNVIIREIKIVEQE